MSELEGARRGRLARKHRELGWFGWFAYGLFAVAAVGLIVWVCTYAVSGGWKTAITETLPYWLSGIGGPAALVAIYETNKRTRQVERTVGDLASVTDGQGQKSGAQVAWRVDEVSKSRRRITNVGAATAESVTVSDVTNAEGRSGFYILDEELPHDVPVNDAIEAGIERSMADPFVSRIRIHWAEGGEMYDATYSIT